MSISQQVPAFVERRAKLLAELCLEELGPRFLVRSTVELEYDYIIGFLNSRGGINNIAVVLKATQLLIEGRIPIQTDAYSRWLNSNLPTMILVADVSTDQLWYAWPSEDHGPTDSHQTTIDVKLAKLTNKARQELLKRFRD